MRESVVYQSIKTEGGDEKARQIAINMLIEGMSVDLVAKLTGLSVEQVQQLEQQQTQE